MGEHARALGVMSEYLRPRLLVDSKGLDLLHPTLSPFPWSLKIDVAADMPSLDTDHRFEFTAEFTGRLGSMGAYRFNPMIRVQKGQRYRVCITPETGTTLFTPLGDGRDEIIKTVSSKLLRIS